MPSEKPILMTTESVKAILEGRKTQTRRVLTPKTSEVGEGRVDWAKFCWDGSHIFCDTCRHGHTEEHKAPLPFVDGRANENYLYEYQYLHVPYNWEEDMTIFRIYPKYEVGDRLWVRERWRIGAYTYQKWAEINYKALGGILILKEWNEWLEKNTQYGASNVGDGDKWRPSIFMPKWASRITLEITGIRVERLQEITAEDVIKEGIDLSVAEIVNEYVDNPNYPKYSEIFANLWGSLNTKRGYPWENNPWVWVIEFKGLK